MRVIHPWIYVDHLNNVWKFYLNGDNDLVYSIMYDEGKWTKESLIDTGVTGFAVYIDEDGTLHIVYGKKGELRYCTMKDKQWFGKLLYSLKGEGTEICDIKVEILGENMHIFCLLVDGQQGSHGKLIHCRWDGKETHINVLQDIKLISYVKEHYAVYRAEDGCIYVFFVTADENNVASLRYCSYRDNYWSPIKRLYRLEAESLCFDVLVIQQGIHILNGFKEKSKYHLEHVALDNRGMISHFRIYENDAELIEPMLFMEENKLYTCWMEQGKICYSGFSGDAWEEPVKIALNDRFSLQKYNCFIYLKDEEGCLRWVYGTKEPDFYMIIPNRLVRVESGFLEYRRNQDIMAALREDYQLTKLKDKLLQLETENAALKKEITALNLQLQKKQRLIEEYEENIARILEQKKVIEERCAVYVEVLGSIQKELDEAKQQLAHQMQVTEEVQKKLQDTQEENMRLRERIEGFMNPDEEADQQFTIMMSGTVEGRFDAEEPYEQVHPRKGRSVMDALSWLREKMVRHSTFRSRDK